MIETAAFGHGPIARLARGFIAVRDLVDMGTTVCVGQLDGLYEVRLVQARPGTGLFVAESLTDAVEAAAGREIKKQCLRCLEFKRPREFSHSAECDDALWRYCRACEALRIKAWKAEHPRRR